MMRSKWEYTYCEIRDMLRNCKDEVTVVQFTYDLNACLVYGVQLNRLTLWKMIELRIIEIRTQDAAHKNES